MRLPLSGLQDAAHRSPGPRKIHHFAHRGSGKGCGGGLETNAHLWAKQALREALWIHLPEIRPKAAGLSRLVHPGGRYAFIDAKLETQAGEIVPDVQLIAADGRKLIVEILVTHACDERKIERIREGGVSAIEVDLSPWKNSNDAETITQALLTGAQRRWLFNRAIDRTEADLIEAAAERARSAAERQRRRAVEEVARLRRQPVREAPDLGTLLTRLVALGYGRLLTGSQPGDGFAVPAELWKAAALHRLIEEAPEYGAFGQVTGDRMLRLISDCLHHDPRPPKQRLPVAALKAAAPDYQTPQEALEAFVETLHQADVLYYWKGDLWLNSSVVKDAQAWDEARRREADAQHARDRRTKEIEAILARLVQRADALPTDDTFSLETWKRDIPGMGGRSLADILNADDEHWRRFRTELSVIAAMLDGGPPAEALLGLPFEAALAEAHAQAELIAAEEKATVERKIAADRSVRANAIWTEAHLVLGLEADSWLAGDWDSVGSRREAAAASDDGLMRIRSALGQKARELKEERRKAAVAETFRSRLRQAAASALSAAHAAFFLSNRRAELDWKTPLEHCRDDRSFEASKRLLPGKKTRR